MDIRQRILALNIAGRIDSEVEPPQLRMNFMTDGADQQTVWSYVTEPELLAAWSPKVPDRPLTSVGPAEARENPEDAPFSVEVLAVDPGKQVTHRWGDDLITWTITGDRIDFAIVLRELNAAAMYAAGWQVCFGVLAALLQGEQQPRIVGEDAFRVGWQELKERYDVEFARP